ncbi:MAG: M48 family metallopeptidase [Devosia sp.]|uniref:M48 family metallopeptidase n=1 Tax=Devosia sp. TaxID=1871048 RepID=UPI0024C79187|nr:M48 family metallopeptidase [Devosia sp.]UYN99444.1 MAG: M48 family metallopeptidase [Devosia sp.]
MTIPARYHDGLVSSVHSVALSHIGQGGSGLLVLSAPTGAEMARFDDQSLYLVPSRANEMRLGITGQSDGARIVVTGREDIARIRATIPNLARRHQHERGRQVRLAALSTMALASVIAAYLFGIPLIASRLVQLVPPAWESAIGATVSGQLEASLGGETGLPACDPDPDSLANRAIARFAAEAMAGAGTPFAPRVTVVRSDIPNAFAVPGGNVYFFSALLDAAESPDEFAGVLAHELGHVAHRHGMEQLVSTAGTGALVGFILGDMTGISVAASLGATIIDARFSREAEKQADRFAAGVAQRLDFEPWALAELIGRVGEDTDYSRAMALLSTHPLTNDRRVALTDLGQNRPSGLEPPFAPAEWAAIQSMCDI